MKTVRPSRPAALLSMLAGAACSTAAPAGGQDISFVHGCWISPHDVAGVPVDTLRLLTDGETGTHYSGQLLRYNNGAASVVATLTFRRDGSHAVIDWGNRPSLWSHEEFRNERRAIFPNSPAGWSRAVFRKTGAQGWITVEGVGERLRVHERPDGPSGFTFDIFDGQRDGCD